MFNWDEGLIVYGRNFRPGNPVWISFSKYSIGTGDKVNGFI